jgi:isocitrate/isopropylmalate dehydrogenase
VAYVLGSIRAHDNALTRLQASIDAHGTPLTDDALAAAKGADAILLGAIGGPVSTIALTTLFTAPV